MRRKFDFLFMKTASGKDSFFLQEAVFLFIVFRVQQPFFPISQKVTGRK